jgi:septin family protein
MTLHVALLSSLKALDLVTMKKLDSKVNIIPVIAKADTITKTELQKFKTKVGPGFFTCYPSPTCLH